MDTLLCTTISIGNCQLARGESYRCYFVQFYVFLLQFQFKKIKLAREICRLSSIPSCLLLSVKVDLSVAVLDLHLIPQFFLLRERDTATSTAAYKHFLFSSLVSNLSLETEACALRV